MTRNSAEADLEEMNEYHPLDCYSFCRAYLQVWYQREAISYPSVLYVLLVFDILNGVPELRSSEFYQYVLSSTHYPAIDGLQIRRSSSISP